MNNGLLEFLMEDSQFVDIMTPELNTVLREYDTSGKNSTVMERLRHSNAYNVTQTTITAYIKQLSKCSNKKEVESLYEKEVKTSDVAVEKLEKQIDKFKKLGRDDESKFEKEGLYNNAGFKLSFKKTMIVGVLAGILGAFNPVLSLSGPAIAYIFSIMDTINDSAAGVYMYNKWLKAEGKTITNKVKNKLK